MLQQLVNGLILGSVYASGPWLPWCVNYQIDQLCPWDIYMVGAFIGYFLLNSVEEWTSLSLLLAMVGTAILGVVIEYLAYRPLRHSDSDFSLDHSHQGFLLARIWDGLLRRCQYPFPSRKWLKRFVTTSVYLISIFSCLFSWWIKLFNLLFKKQRWESHAGCSVDSDAAQLMGINVNRTISFAFALGSALAGAGGASWLVCITTRSSLWWGWHQGSKPLSPSWRNQVIPVLPRWICYRFCWKPSLQRSVFQTSVIPLYTILIVIFIRQRYPR